MAGRRQFVDREKYISELPFSVMNKVHNILDIGDGWKKLGMCTTFFVQMCSKIENCKHFQMSENANPEQNRRDYTQIYCDISCSRAHNSSVVSLVKHSQEDMLKT